MNEPHEDWETRIQNTARGFAYPPTPDVSVLLRRGRHVSVQRLAQIAAILLLLLIGLMLAVPEIRAQVVALFHIGAVDVIVTTATPPAQFNGGSDLPSSVLDFPGATTLDNARQHFGYPIPLPSALGAPDRVYLIQASKPIVALAWLASSGAVDVSLQLFPPDTYVLKMTSGTPEPTHVNGTDAIWIAGQHWYMLHTTGDAYQMRVVNMPALIWSTADDMTYRLETNRSLNEALKIAESLPMGTPTP